MDDWLMPGIPRTIADEPDIETVRRIRASVTSDTGQVVESDLLLPCPFCGGRPWAQVYELDDTCVEARVVCAGCHVSTVRECQSWKVSYMGDDLTRTLAIGRAISVWNRRSERTCRVVTKERRFSQTQTLVTKSCSACGYAFGDEEKRPILPGLDETMVLNPVNVPNYCPHCGARVVDE